MDRRGRRQPDRLADVTHRRRVAVRRRVALDEVEDLLLSLGQIHLVCSLIRVDSQSAAVERVFVNLALSADGPPPAAPVHGPGPARVQGYTGRPRACGGIGRRARLRALWTNWSVEVRVLSGAWRKAPLAARLFPCRRSRRGQRGNALLILRRHPPRRERRPAGVRSEADHRRQGRHHAAEPRVPHQGLALGSVAVRTAGSHTTQPFILVSGRSRCQGSSRPPGAVLP